MEVSRFLKTLAVAWSLAISQPWVAQENQILQEELNPFKSSVEWIIFPGDTKVYLAVIWGKWEKVDTYTIEPNSYMWNKSCTISYKWRVAYLLDLEGDNNPYTTLRNLIEKNPDDDFENSLLSYKPWLVEVDEGCIEENAICLTTDELFNDILKELKKKDCGRNNEQTIALTS